MTEISEKAKQELLNLSSSASFRKDMQTIKANRHNPFLKDSRVDTDAYIEFLNQFNEFINHAPKPFRPMIDKDMKL